LCDTLLLFLSFLLAFPDDLLLASPKVFLLLLVPGQLLLPLSDQLLLLSLELWSLWRNWRRIRRRTRVYVVRTAFC
jgi:hypothetical protein